MPYRTPRGRPWIAGPSVLAWPNVTRSCYVGWLENRYSFTPHGLRSVELAGITAREVWEILHTPAGRRMIRHLKDEGTTTVCGVTAVGRYVMVGLQESAFEDCDWDIVAARDLQADEKAVFDRYIRRQS